MTIVWASALTLFNLFWLALTLLGLPGNWLMIAGALTLSLVLDEPLIATGTLIAVVILAALAEVYELIAGASGAKKAGGSRRAAVGALFGGFAGAILGTFIIPIPVIGTLTGAAAGAFLGAATLELTTGRAPRAAAGVGRSAMIGHLKGNLVKLATGAAIWLTLTISAFNS
jgi:uncharacterized protein YqgC (DUF456 family)